MSTVNETTAELERTLTGIKLFYESHDTNINVRPGLKALKYYVELKKGDSVEGDPGKDGLVGLDGLMGMVGGKEGSKSEKTFAIQEGTAPRILEIDLLETGTDAVPSVLIFLYSGAIFTKVIPINLLTISRTVSRAIFESNAESGTRCHISTSTVGNLLCYIAYIKEDSKILIRLPAELNIYEAIANIQEYTYFKGEKGDSVKGGKGDKGDPGIGQPGLDGMIDGNESIIDTLSVGSTSNTNPRLLEISLDTSDDSFIPSVYITIESSGFVNKKLPLNLLTIANIANRLAFTADSGTRFYLTSTSNVEYACYVSYIESTSNVLIQVHEVFNPFDLSVNIQQYASIEPGIKLSGLQYTIWRTTSLYHLIFNSIPISNSIIVKVEKQNIGVVIIYRAVYRTIISGV